MLIGSYDQWREHKRHVLEEENPEIECEECNGRGQFYELCNCCGAEKEEMCVVCNGAGTIRYLESPQPRLGSAVFGPKAYFQEVIADLKKWCAYTGDDFLELAAPFVGEFRRDW